MRLSAAVSFMALRTEKVYETCGGRQIYGQDADLHSADSEFQKAVTDRKGTGDDSHGRAVGIFSHEDRP